MVDRVALQLEQACLTLILTIHPQFISTTYHDVKPIKVPLPLVRLPDITLRTWEHNLCKGKEVTGGGCTSKEGVASRAFLSEARPHHAAISVAVCMVHSCCKDSPRYPRFVINTPHGASLLRALSSTSARTPPPALSAVLAQ
jgi:hypothetical protein